MAKCINGNVVFNSETEFVKHIIWKDFESAKRSVTEFIDSKDGLSPAKVISDVHCYLTDLVLFLRSDK